MKAKFYDYHCIFVSYISTSIELFASFLRYQSIVKWLLCCCYHSTYLITVVVVGETDNTCTCCCYTSGIFSLRFYRLIYCARWFQFSFFGSNNDQLWLDESSKFSLDWNSVVLHWIRKVFGFVMITFYIYLPKNNLLKNVIQQLTLSYFFWHFKVCFDEIIELGTRNCCIKFLCLDLLSFLSIILQKIF